VNRTAAHTALVRQVLAAIGSLPGVIAGDNPCGLAKYPRRDDPTKVFAVPYGWPVSEGSPDILVAVYGRLVALEVKTSAAKPTPEQLRCHEALRAVGVVVVVVRSVNDALEAVNQVRWRAA
jgi:hypothetical protein